MDVTEYEFDSNVSFKKAEKVFGNPIRVKFTQYVKNDLYYEFYDNSRKDIKTYQKQLISEEGDTKTFRKQKIPYHQFPSTSQLDNIFYIQRVSFCIHFNVYLNFETKIINDRDCIQRVYMNVNHISDVDQTVTETAIEKTKNFMKQFKR
jgi:hypothetical protein